MFNYSDIFVCEVHRLYWSTCLRKTKVNNTVGKIQPKTRHYKYLGAIIMTNMVYLMSVYKIKVSFYSCIEIYSHIKNKRNLVKYVKVLENLSLLFLTIFIVLLCTCISYASQHIFVLRIQSTVETSRDLYHCLNINCAVCLRYYKVIVTLM